MNNDITKLMVDKLHDYLFKIGKDEVADTWQEIFEIYKYTDEEDRFITIDQKQLMEKIMENCYNVINPKDQRD